MGLKVALKRRFGLLPLGYLYRGIDCLFLDAGGAARKQVGPLPADAQTLIIRGRDGSSSIPLMLASSMERTASSLKDRSTSAPNACFPTIPKPRRGGSGKSFLSSGQASATSKWPCCVRQRRGRTAQIALMPAQASPTALASLRCRFLAWSVSSTTKQRPPKDGCDKPALPKSYEELRTKPRSFPKNLGTRSKQVDPDPLDLLGPCEPAGPAIKMRGKPQTDPNNP